MKKKSLYTVVAFLILVGVYGYDYILNNQQEAEVITESQQPEVKPNFYFLPTSTTGQIIHHQNYVLSYSELHEQAEWVAYELKASHISKTNYKRPYFEVDKTVKTGAAHWRNYKNSGYDKGHLCPAGDRRFSKFAHDETFLTSNISPQNHQFNAGLWNRLEQKIRYWAKKYNGVYVVTGGVLSNNLKTIGGDKVAVPNQFYKVVLDYSSTTPKVIAFLMPHKDSDLPLYKFVVSVDTIEQLTGIDFFPRLEDALEAKIEASKAYKHWSFDRG